MADDEKRLEELGALGLGAEIYLRKSRENPITAFETRAAMAAFTCGFDLISKKGFRHSVDGEADTPMKVAESRRVTWMWDLKKTAQFLTATGIETINVAEFFQRFESLEWCTAHPDHPIAYLRYFVKKTGDGLAKIHSTRPTLRYYRDETTVTAPHDATPEEIEEYFDSMEKS